MDEPIWEIIPREPFTNISTNPAVEVLPMRGRSRNWVMLSRFTGVSEDDLIAMEIGDEYEARNNSIVRRVA
jgi:hypothetical protein